MVSVYIATSIDGFIAGPDGDLDWLDSVPNPDENDYGFAAFMGTVDALLMGRRTFETVCGFEGDWPYEKPVFVLSNTLSSVPEHLQGKAEIVSGSVAEALQHVRNRGHQHIYVDGGKVIQGCLAEGLVDEMILFRLPVLLGGGTPLFGALDRTMHFELLGSEVLAGAITRTHYRQQR